MSKVLSESGDTIVYEDRADLMQQARDCVDECEVGLAPKFAMLANM